MSRITLEKAPAPIWMRLLIPVAAVVVTFIITSVLVIWSGADPLEAYRYFLLVPLSDKTSALEVLVKATPILFTGCISGFRLLGRLL